MKETLISFISYQDKEFLWCYDEIICALSKVDIKTLQVKCVLPPMKILIDEKYEVRKIIGWKNKIIILPKEIGKKWVIYDKLSEKVEYDIFCLENYSATDAFLMEDKLILVPVYIKDPIIVIDLQKKQVIKKIGLPSVDFLPEGQIWNAKVNQEDICFLIPNSFFYGRLNKEEFSLIKIEASEPFLCADFYMDVGWAVDCQGKYLYQFNKEGKLLEIYPAEVGTRFVRIIVKGKYIYLLPDVKSGIRVFDINEKLIKKIGEEKIRNLKCPELLNLPDYWEYTEINKCMWFLPLNYSLQIVNTDNLICKRELLEYTKDFSENQYWEYYKYVQIIRNKPIFIENSAHTSFKRYLELIKRNKNNIESIKILSCSECIWRILNRR